MASETQQGPSAPAEPTGPSIAPVQQAPAPAPRERRARDFAPRRPQQSAVSATPGIPDLLRVATEDALQYDIPHDEPSSYIPSTWNYYALVDAMDTQMAQTRRFYETTAWHPLMSQIYFGVLLMIYIMMVSSQNSLATQEQVQIVEWFTSNWKFSEISIPGPLVAFFQSLTVSSSPHEGYGNVSPVLPRKCSANRGNYFMLSHGHAVLLPPLPAIISQIIRLLRQNATAHTFWDTYDHYEEVVGVRVSSITDPAQYIVNMAYVPNGANDPNPNSMATHAFWTLRGQYADLFPNPDMTATTYNQRLQWIQFLGFATFDAQRLPRYTWFSKLLGTMNRYAGFFKGSVTFDKIRTTGLGCNLVVFRPLPENDVYDHEHSRLPNPGTAAVPATPATDTSPAIPAVPAITRTTMTLSRRINRRLGFFGAHADPDLPDLSVQYAQVTALNVDLEDDLPGDIGQSFAFPGFNGHHFGPVWNLSPLRNVVPRDASMGYNANVQTYYHVDTRLTRD